MLFRSDALASESLKEVTVGAVKLQEPKLQGKKSLHDVICFLETGEPPPHLTKGERRWLARKAVRYRLINKDLFCQGKDQVLRKVPSQEDIHRILQSCHNDVCGGHFAYELTCKKILQAGFVWPSLQRDAHFWCKSCDACQRRGLDVSFMVLNSQSLLLGHLKNGESMPLGPCKDRRRKGVHCSRSGLYDQVGRSSAD